MRKIKFRAWDEGNKVMHNDFQFFTSGEEGNDWICFCSNKERRFTEDHRGIVFNNPYFRQQMKIMQFTGLCDRNGREIYEGDVVESDKNCLFDLGRKACAVEYYNGCFITSDTKVPVSILLDSFEPVVIGNIYENPTLLTTKEAL